MSGGFRNPLWFVGVVEYRHDASNDGRVKVRAFGIHSEDKEAMPTEALPWAIVIDGSYGASSSIPDTGEWVFGFFMDGRDAQHPMILGRIPGINLQLPPEAGAPNEVSMIPMASIDKYGKPPLHRAMGGEDAEIGQATIQAASQKNDIESATGETWSEPPIITPEKNLDNRIYTSKNDNNFVVLSDSEDGDGTYILVSHSSGSAIQIDGNGTVFIKSFGDTYNSSEGFTMNRTENDHVTNVGGDYLLKVERGSGKVWINGDLDIECENFNVTARGTANINAAVSTNISGGKVGIFGTSDDINLAAQANIKMKAGTALNFGGIYGQALFGDIHLDSYKMNLYSSAYTKIHSLGTPAVSTQTLPFPDVGHLGIDINSTTSLRMNSLLTMSINATGALGINAGAALGIKSVGTMDLHAGGQLGLGAGGLVNMDGTLVLIGNGTASATAGVATGTVTASKAAQLVQSGTATIPPLSITEVAAVVNPGDIPASRIGVGYSTGANKRTRKPVHLTSRMTDDTTDGASIPGAIASAVNAATAVTKAGTYESKEELEADVSFQDKLKSMIEKFPGLTKDELYRVVQGESNFNTSALNSDSGATGLFQFIPGTAEFLGYTTGEIQNMNATEQLGVYDQYLTKFDYRGGDLGIMQAAPAYANKPKDYEVYAYGTKAWEQNKGWRDTSGKITVASINDYYKNQNV